MRCWALCLSFLISCPAAAKAVIILVHGSFGIASPWYLPGGDFYEELARQAAQLGEKIVPFAWVSVPTQARLNQAALHLAQLILSYGAQERIFLVGHSHGGNVINLATQALHNAEASLAPLTCCCPCSRKQQPQSQLVRPYYSLDQQNYQQVFLTELWRSLHRTHLLLRSKASSTTARRIEAIYLLGTPIDEHFMYPCLQVAKEVYNLFSGGDVVQTVLGRYQRKLPPQNQVYNLEIELCLCGKTIWPDHEQMHHPAIAKNLFRLKEPGTQCAPTRLCLSN